MIDLIDIALILYFFYFLMLLQFLLVNALHPLAQKLLECGVFIFF